MLNACKVSIREAREERAMTIGTANNEFNAVEAMTNFLNQTHGAAVVFNEDVFIVENYSIDTFNGMATFVGKNKKGSAGSTSEVYNIESLIVTYTTNTREAVIKPFNFKIYIANGETFFLCIFHRYGRSGSKSAFINQFRQYVREAYDKIIDIKNVVPPGFVEQVLSGDIKMLTLTKETRIARNTNDIADELDDMQWMRETNAEYVVKAKRRQVLDIGAKIRRFLNNEVELSSLFTVPEMPDYDNAKVTVNTNGTTKTIDLSEIQFIICDKEVTGQLVLVDGHPTDDSINLAFDNYYNELLENNRQ